MKPTIPDHTIEAAESHFVVRVGKDVAGTISQDHEHKGLWFVIGPDGQFMGRVNTKEKAAEFLAAWFVAEDEDWS
jgi:hypothetical protein